jgi:predicted CopG family antitoxin
MDNFHKKLTTISVSHANYLTLKELGKTGDSFNDVLTRILNETMQLRSGQNSVA